MRYTVTWTKSADKNLSEVWLRSKDRSGVSAASHQIDQSLREDAHVKGNEVSEGLRPINIPPLRFLLTANQDDRIVEIAVVREI